MYHGCWPSAELTVHLLALRGHKRPCWLIAATIRYSSSALSKHSHNCSISWPLPKTVIYVVCGALAFPLETSLPSHWPPWARSPARLRLHLKILFLEMGTLFGRDWPQFTGWHLRLYRGSNLSLFCHPSITLQTNQAKSEGLTWE